MAVRALGADIADPLFANGDIAHPALGDVEPGHADRRQFRRRVGHGPHIPLVGRPRDRPVRRQDRLARCRAGEGDEARHVHDGRRRQPVGGRARGLQRHDAPAHFARLDLIRARRPRLLDGHPLRRQPPVGALVDSFVALHIDEHRFRCEVGLNALIDADDHRDVTHERVDDQTSRLLREDRDVALVARHVEAIGHDADRLVAPQLLPVEVGERRLADVVERHIATDGGAHPQDDHLADIGHVLRQFERDIDTTDRRIDDGRRLLRFGLSRQAEERERQKREGEPEPAQSSSPCWTVCAARRFCSARMRSLRKRPGSSGSVCSHSTVGTML